MATDQGISRWAQIVRAPGQARLLGHHPTVVPALGSDAPADAARPGIRLLVHPVEGSTAHYAIDVTSTAALAMLEGFLATGIAVGKTIGWRTAGFGTHRRDTIRIGRS